MRGLILAERRTLGAVLTVAERIRCRASSAALWNRTCGLAVSAAEDGGIIEVEKEDGGRGRGRGRGKPLQSLNGAEGVSGEGRVTVDGDGETGIGSVRGRGRGRMVEGGGRGSDIGGESLGASVERSVWGAGHGSGVGAGPGGSGGLGLAMAGGISRGSKGIGAGLNDQQLTDDTAGGGGGGGGRGGGVVGVRGDRKEDGELGNVVVTRGDGRGLVTGFSGKSLGQGWTPVGGRWMELPNKDGLQPPMTQRGSRGLGAKGENGGGGGGGGGGSAVNGLLPDLDSIPDPVAPGETLTDLLRGPMFRISLGSGQNVPTEQTMRADFGSGRGAGGGGGYAGGARDKDGVRLRAGALGRQSTGQGGTVMGGPMYSDSHLALGRGRGKSSPSASPSPSPPRASIRPSPQSSAPSYRSDVRQQPNRFSGVGRGKIGTGERERERESGRDWNRRSSPEWERRSGAMEGFVFNNAQDGGSSQGADRRRRRGVDRMRELGKVADVAAAGATGGGRSTGKNARHFERRPVEWRERGMDRGRENHGNNEWMPADRRTPEQKRNDEAWEKEMMMLERQKQLLLVDFEPEYAMETFGTLPDLDEEPMPSLENMLVQYKDLLMKLDGMETEEEWQTAMQGVLGRADELEKIVDSYGGPVRMTAKEENESLHKIADSMPSDASPELLAFVKRAELTLQNNPSWPLLQKQRLLSSVISDFAARPAL